MIEDLYEDEAWWKEHFEYEGEYRAVAHAINRRYSGQEHVADIGCGLGLILDEMGQQGWACVAVEPSEMARQLAPDSLGFLPYSVDELAAHPIPPVGLVLCFEVAEHLPADLGPKLVKCLADSTASGGYLLFTAAQPGQGGRGHINERFPSYWLGLLAEYGLTMQSDDTMKLREAFREAAPRMWWLSANLLVLRKC